MMSASMRSPGTAHTASSGPLIDKWSFAPIAAFIFSAIAGPFIAFVTSNGEADFGSNLLNQLMWPAMAAAAVGVAVQNSSRFDRLTWPPPVIWLFVCLALAVASTAWSVKPAYALIRSMQQTMLITSIVLTPMLATGRSADMMRALFFCCAVGVVLNLLIGGRTIAEGQGDIGYSGFMSSKNNLGQFAGVAFLLAAHEAIHRGFRRALGVIIAVLSAFLLVHSESKTSTALAFLSPALAGLMLVLKKHARISTLTAVSTVMFFCVYFKNELAWYVFHDTTFTGRTHIWDFVGSEIDRRPLLGWGFLSFWLTGPDSAAMVDGSGWIAKMPHAHNGYLDMVLQLGYVGFACLVMLISTTILAIERFAKLDPARAWLLLSLTLFIMFNNHLESSWMHSGDFLWVVFVLICAEIGRCWQLYKPTSAARSLKPSLRPAGPGGMRRTRGPIGVKPAIAARHLHARG
jgi:exopolysaccharide production protein ExoQ